MDGKIYTFLCMTHMYNQTHIGWYQIWLDRLLQILYAHGLDPVKEWEKLAQKKQEEYEKMKKTEQDSGGGR